MRTNLRAACETGNLAWLKEQKANGTLGDISENGNCAIYAAVAAGQLEVIKWLAEESGQAVDVTTDNNYVFRIAAENGHLDIVKWLITDSEQAAKTAAYADVAIRFSAVNGHLNVIRWLVEDYRDWIAAKKLDDQNFVRQPVDVTLDNNCATRLAAVNGHLDSVKWLVLKSGQDIDVSELNHYALRMAAVNGHLAVIKWLVIDYPAHLAEKDEDRTKKYYADITNHVTSAVVLAAESGHLDIVKWFVKESGQTIDVTASNLYAVRWTAQNGHLDVVRWLIEDSDQIVDCRNYQTWEAETDVASWPAPIQDYLATVKSLQETLGLEDWKTGLDTLSQTRRRQGSGRVSRI